MALGGPDGHDDHDDECRDDERAPNDPPREEAAELGVELPHDCSSVSSRKTSSSERAMGVSSER